MRGYTLIRISSTHYESFSGKTGETLKRKMLSSDRYRILQVVGGIVVTEDTENGWYYVGLGDAARVPVESKNIVTSEDDPDIKVVKEVSTGKTQSDSPKLVDAADDSEDAIVFLRIEAGYKSNSRLRVENDAEIIRLARVEGHKASWPEAVVRIAPGGMVILEDKWTTLNNRGIRIMGIRWDGKELRHGDPDELDPPSKWSLEDAEIL